MVRWRNVRAFDVSASVHEVDAIELGNHRQPLKAKFGLPTRLHSKEPTLCCHQCSFRGRGIGTPALRSNTLTRWTRPTPRGKYGPIFRTVSRTSSRMRRVSSSARLVWNGNIEAPVIRLAVDGCSRASPARGGPSAARQMLSVSLVIRPGSFRTRTTHRAEASTPTNVDVRARAQLAANSQLA